MGKSFEREASKVTRRRAALVLKRIKKILDKKDDLESAPEERKAGDEPKPNLVLGVYSKESNTFYEIVVTRKSLEHLSGINKLVMAGAD